MFALMFAACGGAPEGDQAAEAKDALGTGTDRWWVIQRQKRQAAVDAHIAANRADFDRFRSAPAGNTGVPMIIFRLLPELFPEIWGPPEENFATVGLASDPFESNRVLPLGLGFSGMDPPIPTPAGPLRMNAVQVTCMSCHSGRVQTDSGEMIALVGAPNTEFQFNRYRALLVQTVNSPGYTASRFVAAVNTKPAGWFYGDAALAAQEQLERAVFLANPDALLGALRAGANASAARLAATLFATTYRRPDAPDLTGRTPGYMDALSGFASLATDPSRFSTVEELAAALPPAPAMCDYMPVWRQGDRPSAKWTGDVVEHTVANAAAAMGMVGSPFAVDMETVNASTRFSEKLPAAPYPFAVARDAVARGRTLYKAYCAECHAAGNENLVPPSEIGTDPNRIDVLTPYTLQSLRTLIRISCDDPATCTDQGTLFPDEVVLRKTGGYAAVPLDGIWARAPYLHNGSVPTLAALLTGDRPTRFYRGNTKYDTVNLGFAWTEPETLASAVYDTTKAGNFNGGHLGPTYNGPIDWANDPKALADLLEFLKTL